MFASMYPWDNLAARPPTRTPPPITLDAPDPEALLIAWLGELLWQWEVERFVPTRIAVQSVAEADDGGWRVQAEVAGVSWDEAPERTGPGVKAVTYQGLALEREDSGWAVEVTLDI